MPINLMLCKWLIHYLSVVKSLLFQLFNVVVVVSKNIWKITSYLIYIWNPAQQPHRGTAPYQLPPDMARRPGPPPKARKASSMSQTQIDLTQYDGESYLKNPLLNFHISNVRDNRHYSLLKTNAKLVNEGKIIYNYIYLCKNTILNISCLFTWDCRPLFMLIVFVEENRSCPKTNSDRHWRGRDTHSGERVWPQDTRVHGHDADTADGRHNRTQAAQLC